MDMAVVPVAVVVMFVVVILVVITIMVVIVGASGGGVTRRSGMGVTVIMAVIVVVIGGTGVIDAHPGLVFGRGAQRCGATGFRRRREFRPRSGRILLQRRRFRPPVST